MVYDRWYIDLQRSVRPSTADSCGRPTTSLYTTTLHHIEPTLCLGHTSYLATQIQGILGRNKRKSTEIHLFSFPPASLNQIGWCGADCLVQPYTARLSGGYHTRDCAHLLGAGAQGYLRQHALMSWCRGRGNESTACSPVTLEFA